MTYAFFFFSLIIDLLFLITGVTIQMFTPPAELAISAEISTKEQKAGIKTHPVTVESKTRKFSV